MISIYPHIWPSRMENLPISICFMQLATIMEAREEVTILCLFIDFDQSRLVVKHIKKYISISSCITYYAPTLQQIKNRADDHDGVLEESCSLFSSIHFRMFMAASTLCASDSTPLSRVKLLDGFRETRVLEDFNKLTN